MSKDIVSSNCILEHTFTCARRYTTQEYDVTDTSLVFGTGERVIRMKSSLQTKRWTRRTNDLVSRFFAISGHRRWHTRVVQNRKSRRPGAKILRSRSASNVSNPSNAFYSCEHYIFILFKGIRAHFSNALPVGYASLLQFLSQFLDGRALFIVEE